MDYDVVRDSVQNAYKYFGQNDNKFRSSMENYYKEGEKNPTVARIILQDRIKDALAASRDMLNYAAAIHPSEAMMYPEAALRIPQISLQMAMKSITAQDMYKDTVEMPSRKSFDKKWNTLYPKTGEKRERIIESGRMSANHVTHKASWYNKINFAKTLAEYKKDYPKTFYARYMLILNEQIKEGEITPKVKNWFKRFSYKKLIKNGFSFKK